MTLKKNSAFFWPIDLLVNKKNVRKKFRIWETPKLSTDADRSIDTKRKLFLRVVWTDERKYGHTERGVGGGDQMS